MKRFILFILLTFPLLLSAQRKYTAGQVVTRDGDIIKGEIDYREWVINPRTIKFRTGEMVTTYGPKELRSFRIDSKNEIYESAVVLVNQESLDWEDLPQYQTYAEVDGEMEMKQDTVFLMVLTRGRVNLYQLIDRQKRNHFYFRKGNGAYEPLIYRKIKVMRPGQILMANVLEDNNLPRALVFEDYKGQLKYILADCGMLDSAIDKLTYSRSILDVVNRYNECMGQVIYLKPKDRARHFAYLQGGRARSFFAIVDADNTAASTMPETWSTTYGLGLELGIPRSRGKFTWSLEALYLQAGSSTTTTFGPLDLGATERRYTLDLEGFRLAILLKYNLFIGNIQPYLKAGAGNLIYTQRSYQVQDLILQQERPQSLLASEPFIVAGGGIKIYDFFAEARYNTGNDINRTTGFDTKIKSFSLLIGYALPLTKELK